MDQAVIPFSKEAEEALIGLVIIGGTIAEIELSADDFYIHRHRFVWEAFTSLDRRGAGIDIVTIADELKRAGHLEEIGGPAGLSAFLGYTESLGYWSIPDCVEIIRNYSRRRKLLELANDIARAAYDQGADIEAVASGFIDRIAKAASTRRGAVHWGKFLDELYQEVDERSKNPRDIWGSATGWNRFDKILGGLQAGESLLLSGKPGVGKSLFTMQMAMQLAKNEPGAIYSLEMRGLQVARRAASSKSGVRARALKTGRLGGDDWPKFIQAYEALADLPIYMSDDPSMSIAALRTDLMRLKNTHGVKWFIFDYLMLASDGPGMDEIEKTAMISRGMKLLTRGVDIAGVTIHSMNKAGVESAKPDQQNLRGSGQVAYDADVIAFLTEFQALGINDGFIPPQQQANMRTLFFAKGRDLEAADKYIHFVKLPDFPTFGEYEPEPTPAQRMIKK